MGGRVNHVSFYENNIIVRALLQPLRLQVWRRAVATICCPAYLVFLTAPPAGTAPFPPSTAFAAARASCAGVRSAAPRQGGSHHAGRTPRDRPLAGEMRQSAGEMRQSAALCAVPAGAQRAGQGRSAPPAWRPPLARLPTRSAAPACTTLALPQRAARAVRRPHCELGATGAHSTGARGALAACRLHLRFLGPQHLLLLARRLRRLGGARGLLRRRLVVELLLDGSLKHGRLPVQRQAARLLLRRRRRPLLLDAAGELGHLRAAWGGRRCARRRRRRAGGRASG